MRHTNDSSLQIMNIVYCSLFVYYGFLTLSFSKPNINNVPHTHTHVQWPLGILHDRGFQIRRNCLSQWHNLHCGENKTRIPAHCRNVHNGRQQPSPTMWRKCKLPANQNLIRTTSRCWLNCTTNLRQKFSFSKFC